MRRVTPLLAAWPLAAALLASAPGRCRARSPERPEVALSTAEISEAADELIGLGRRARGFSLSWSTGTPILEAPPPPPEPARRDLQLVWRYREGLRRVLRFARESPQAFARAPGTQTWLDEDRALVQRTWASALDYLLALDAVARHNAPAWAGRPRDRDARAELAAGYAAWLGSYAWVLEWSAECDRDPSLVDLLDKPVPELGLPGGTYARLKSVLAELRRRGAFESGRARYLALKPQGALEWAIGGPAARELDAQLEREARALRGRGPARPRGGSAPASWLEGWSAEVRPAAFEWVVAASTLCDPYRWQSLEERLRPGDIVLVRRPPYLGDVGLPGWWNAAAIHVGTERERRAAFGWPESHSRYRRRSACPPRFLAATERGVRPETMRELAALGAFAVLRPRLPAAERGEAVRRAFAYLGAPFNFSFDVAANARTAGGELVRRAFAPPGAPPRLLLPAGETLGRETAAANDVAEMFDDEFGRSAQQLELVCFVDEDGVVSGLEEFRRTWRRPKWDLKSGGNHERT